MLVSRSRPPALTWAALLGFALFAPAALPAGGAERRLPELRRRESAQEPLLNLLSCSLRASPRCQAPVLTRLEPGMPMRVMRTWLEPSGRRWLQVTTAGPSGRQTRGWLLG
ncbi:MAG: SH3 domain-containing protein [Cyanobium sp.]|nr:SH3 domain-containing protein [Cyanobacteriota bacterium]